MAILKILSKDEVIKNFTALVGSERKLTAEIIDYIREIDVRKIYLDLGYTSLFAYLTESMGYTPASAQRRIDSARLLSELPEIKNDLKSGALNLMQLSVIAQSVRTKAKQSSARVTREEKKDLLKQVQNQDLFETQTTVAQFLDLDVQQFEKVRPQQDDSVRLELTLSKTDFENLRRVKEVLSTTHQHLTNQEVFALLCQDFLKRKDPIEMEKRAEGRRLRKQLESEKPIEVQIQVNSQGQFAPQRFSASSHGVQMPVASDQEVQMPSGPNIEKAQMLTVSHQNVQTRANQKVQTAATSRMEVTSIRKSLPLKTRRTILKRDQCCQWRDPKSNKLCGSKFVLHIDHLQPRWAGGNDSIENLQVLCAIHNQLKYQREAGIKLIDRGPSQGDLFFES